MTPALAMVSFARQVVVGDQPSFPCLAAPGSQSSSLSLCSPTTSFSLSCLWALLSLLPRHCSSFKPLTPWRRQKHARSGRLEEGAAFWFTLTTPLMCQLVGLLNQALLATKPAAQLGQCVCVGGGELCVGFQDSASMIPKLGLGLQPFCCAPWSRDPRGHRAGPLPLPPGFSGSPGAGAGGGPKHSPPGLRLVEGREICGPGPEPASLLQSGGCGGREAGSRLKQEAGRAGGGAAGAAEPAQGAGYPGQRIVPAARAPRPHGESPGAAPEPPALARHEAAWPQPSAPGRASPAVPPRAGRLSSTPPAWGCPGVRSASPQDQPCATAPGVNRTASPGPPPGPGMTPA